MHDDEEAQDDEAEDEEDGDAEDGDEKDGDAEDETTEQNDTAEVLDTSSGELPAVTPGGDAVVGGLHKSSTDTHYFYQGIELM